MRAKSSHPRRYCSTGSGHTTPGKILHLSGQAGVPEREGRPVNNSSLGRRGGARFTNLSPATGLFLSGAITQISYGLPGGSAQESSESAHYGVSYRQQQ